MIALPDWPGPADAQPGYVDFGGWQGSPLGARVQRIDRPGNRFKLAVQMPPMPSAALGRIWVSRLITGMTEGVRMEFPLLGFDPGAPGAPVADGDGQAGRVLAVRGFTPHYVMREGQFFHHASAAGLLLYKVDAETIADGAGKAEVPISPMLREEPADGEAMEFGKPMIEGRVLGEEWRWQMQLGNNIGLSFEIEELA
ncbi:hypothetical protein [Allosphingosinicella indica]|uniref:Uncharacterized protein n=1 Tax=Allosphingosinicella indica TaxID=941907 RepID=A0A1X7GJ56_9SPHN|nr:hypothetical protein [Allosphingosinicella indica]SMF70506.1 hypothetical protein SAMN06295910_1889 [Allosphingosinicella indica]